MLFFTEGQQNPEGKPTLQPKNFPLEKLVDAS